jgi:hypothetical protein
MSLILAGCTNAGDTRHERPYPTQQVAKSNSDNPEVTLEKYLFYRANGRYKKCEKFLSKHFMDEFVKTFGTKYASYFRNQDEENYRGYKILSTKKTERNMAVIHVMVEVEGPGYKYEALEQYFMIRKNNGWQINAWQFEDEDYRIKWGISP